VSSLPAEFGNQISVRQVSHLEPEAKQVVRELGWANHGLVIRENGKIMYSASDHRANGFDALVALKMKFDLPFDCREPSAP
jgi:hypothetical protein